jgi:hypothetical protein
MTALVPCTTVASSSLRRKLLVMLAARLSKRFGRSVTELSTCIGEGRYFALVPFPTEMWYPLGTLRGTFPWNVPFVWASWSMYSRVVTSSKNREWSSLPMLLIDVCGMLKLPSRMRSMVRGTISRHLRRQLIVRRLTLSRIACCRHKVALLWVWDVPDRPIGSIWAV